MQRFIALGLALYSFIVIKMSIPRLPARIPTHYNAAGDADGWGSPDMLWTLLLAQVSVGGLFLVIPLLGRYFPGMVNIGSRKLTDFAPEQQERITLLFTDMMGYMSVLVSLLLCVLIRGTISAASSEHPHFAPWWVLGIFLAGTAATAIYYSIRMFAVTNETRKGSPGGT